MCIRDRGGFLLQGTFYADDDAAFIGKVFGDVFTVFIIELAQHAFSYKYDIMALSLIHILMVSSSDWRASSSVGLGGMGPPNSRSRLEVMPEGCISA